MAGGGIIGGLSGAFGSITSTVLTRYKADTGDQKRGLKELSREEQKYAKTTIESMEKQNRSIDKQIASWAKAAVAVAAVGAAYAKMSDAMAVFAKDSQLQHAAMGKSIDKLRVASHGLLNEQQLLELAAAANNAVFRLSQDELENVAGWITQLGHEGNDLTEVFNTMKKSIAEGGVEELQKFGVRLENLRGQLAGKGTRDAMSQLLEAAAVGAEKFIDVAGDKAVKATNDLSNATRQLNVDMGNLATQVLPSVYSALGLVAQGYSDLAGLFAGKGIDDIAGTRAGKIRDLKYEAAILSRQIGFEESGTNLGLAGAARTGDVAGLKAKRLALREQIASLKLQEFADTDARNREARLKKWRQENAARIAAAAMARAGGGGRGRGRGVERQISFGLPQEQVPGAGPGFAGLMDAGMMWSQDVGLSDIGAQQSYAPQGQEYKTLTDQQAHMQSLQESLGGGVEAFTMFRDAGTQAFNAWITGSASMEQAFRKALGGMIASKAMGLFATAIEHGALASVALFTGNFPGAAGHAKAAAIAGGKALALGAIARRMGHTGRVGAGGGAGGGVGAMAGVGGGAGERRPTVIVLSSDYADDRYAAAARARRALDRAEQEEGTGGAVEYN